MHLRDHQKLSLRFQQFHIKIESLKSSFNQSFSREISMTLSFMNFRLHFFIISLTILVEKKNCTKRSFMCYSAQQQNIQNIGALLKHKRSFVQTVEQRKVTSSVWFQRLQCQGLGIVRNKASQCIYDKEGTKKLFIEEKKERE